MNNTLELELVTTLEYYGYVPTPVVLTVLSYTP